MYDEKQTEYFSAERRQVLELLPTYTDRVLEIGCGAGQTLQLIKKNHKCRETVGVELMPVAVDLAKNKVDIVYNANIESLEDTKFLGQYGLVLLLDVLEHLVDPWLTLKKVVDENLEESGVVIISLPNVRYFRVVMSLIAGRFEYTKFGIMDKTHLRFFCKINMINLCENAGLNVTKIVKANGSGMLSKLINIITLRLFEDFLTVQYFIVAEK